MRGILFFAKISLAVIAPALVGGCATTYMDARNPLAFAGGYWERPGPGKLTTVGFSANGFTSSDLAWKYLLRRCAEISESQNKPYFLLYETPADAVGHYPVKNFQIFKLGNKPNPTIYLLLQDQPSTDSFETSKELLKTDETSNAPKQV